MGPGSWQLKELRSDTKLGEPLGQGFLQFYSKYLALGFVTTTIIIDLAGSC